MRRPMNSFALGQKVWITVSVAGESRRICPGVVVGVRDGYYDVDRMSLHGGASWITQHTHLEKFDPKDQS